MADTDIQPIPKEGKRMGQGIDWRALSQYGGVTLAALAVSLSGWVHSMLMSIGERVTKLEGKNEAAVLIRDGETKQRDKDATALQDSIKELRATLSEQMRSLDQRQSQMAQGVTALQLDLVRATAGRPGSGQQ